MSAATLEYYPVITGFTIFVCNLLFIFFCQPLIQLIGINYKTNERVVTSLTIFTCLLLNSMIMPILLQANFSTDYPGSFWDSLFTKGGRNSDFGPQWYLDISSQLMVNLVMLSLMPVFIVLVEMIKLRIVRFFKRRQYAYHTNN